MTTLSLVDAFARFGAKPTHRLRGLSAIAEDGALVLSCRVQKFRRQAPGVLRYEDALTREPADEQRTALLGQHLTLARDGQLPVRMVVIATEGEGKMGPNIHVRVDLVGKITEFDGDRFIVDFTRVPPPVTAKRRS